MKAKIILFAVLAAVLIAVLPMLNLLYLDMNPKKSWYRQLYKGDLIITELSDYLRHYGISVLPEQAVIGKDGWMFLGDRYVKTISSKRHGRTPKDEAAAKRIAAAFDFWEEWLQKQGVDDFHIIMGADKATAYPDYLPQWAKPSQTPPVDALFEHVGAYYIDTRPAIAQAREQYSQPLYYSYDSHWNNIGAWVGFWQYLKEICPKEQLQCLQNDEVNIEPARQEVISGIANFFGLADRAKDTVHPVSFASVPHVAVEYYDYRTGDYKRTASSAEEIGKPHIAMHTKSRQALNQKKVLWLRDSFGNAMGPYMALMFSDVVQINYRRVSPAEFKQMVEEYQPDYVLMTIVERQVRDKFFQKYSPQYEQFFKRFQ